MRHYFHGDLRPNQRRYYDARKDEFVKVPENLLVEAQDLLRLQFQLRLFKKSKGKYPTPPLQRPVDAPNVFIGHPDFSLSTRELRQRARDERTRRFARGE